MEQEDDLKKILWNLAQEEAINISKAFPDSFAFNDNSEFIFYESFDNYMTDIKSNFMQDGVNTLDSHKIAAITICSIINSNILKVIFKYDKEEKLFIGNEKIAFTIGLSYMNTAMRELLKDTSESIKFKDYVMPEALICDTDYITILCRNLYYAKTYYKLNPIDLANTLFLLENFNLVNFGINLNIVKERYGEL